MIFFDNTYIDLSIKARLKRQMYSVKSARAGLIKRINKVCYFISTKLFYLRRKLSYQTKKIKELTDQHRWIASATYINRGICNKNIHKEDLSIDGYINKYGGIKSQINEKVYTNKIDYLNHIKASGKTINDWS